MKKKSLKEVVAEEIEKNSNINKKAIATAMSLDWGNIIKGIVWDGLEYKLKLNSNGTIFADSKEEKRDMPKEIVVQIMDLYNKAGQCVRNYKENR